MIYLGLAMFLLYLIFKILYIFYPLCSKNHSVLTDKVSCYKSFALLIPAYNEEHVILNCINSLKVLPYPNYRVYIIDDGSADKTIEILSKHLLLMPARIKEDVRLQYQPILAKYRSGVFPHIYVISKTGAKRIHLTLALPVAGRRSSSRLMQTVCSKKMP